MSGWKRRVLRPWVGTQALTISGVNLYTCIMCSYEVPSQSSSFPSRKRHRGQCHGMRMSDKSRAELSLPELPCANCIVLGTRTPANVTISAMRVPLAIVAGAKFCCLRPRGSEGKFGELKAYLSILGDLPGVPLNRAGIKAGRDQKAGIAARRS